ncbi:MAG: 2-oxoacid:acceptor oxidoreductase family protein [Candidatus Coatesbacteria bacterium]|nr:MAG: 2-oxoacid:acceptor oxidoreductase family protein [Candidatus Coatesbacteria bacterium]
MIEIRFHGRGGQGAALASSIIAEAFFREGKEVQSFPMFGVERRGAPVAAYIRVDDKPIRVKCEIEEPNYVLVLDPTLTEAVDVTAGVKPGGTIIVNTPKEPADAGLDGDFEVVTVDGSSIAVENGLGSRLAPIVNTTMLGALAAGSGVVGIDAVADAISTYFPKDDGKNANAARRAYEVLTG